MMSLASSFPMHWAMTSLAPGDWDRLREQDVPLRICREWQNLVLQAFGEALKPARPVLSLRS
jgi:hypothetical protein